MVVVLLHPRRLSLEYRIRALAPRYGERKLAREAAKIPLLAKLPGFLQTAEEYARDQEEGQERWIRSMRAHIAGSWLKVLAWRRLATDDDRMAFLVSWKFLPHTPEYALDLIHTIRKNKRKEVLRG